MGGTLPFPDIALCVSVHAVPVAATCTPAPKLSRTMQRDTVPPLPPARTPAETGLAPRPFRRTVRLSSVMPPVPVNASTPGPSPDCSSERVSVSAPLAATTTWPSVALPLALPSSVQPSTCQPLEPAVSAMPLPAPKPMRQSWIVPLSPPSTRTWSHRMRSPAPGEVKLCEVVPSTQRSIEARSAPEPTRMAALASLATAVPNDSSVRFATARSLACKSRPTPTPLAPRSSTSGPASAVVLNASTPTLAALLTSAGFVLPTLLVWVAPSMRVAASLSGGSAVAQVTSTTPPVSRFASPARRPACAAASETMNTLVSTPAVSPDCARPAFPSAFAFAMNCRRLPCPASFALTMVSKLKPKSTPLTLPVLNVTGLTDCAVVVVVVSVVSAALVVFAGASARAGISPPTWSLTALAEPALASVRNTCTGTSPATEPGRVDATLAFTTRTV